MKILVLLLFFLSTILYCQTTKKFKGTYHKKNIELIVHFEKNEEKRHSGEMKFLDQINTIYNVFFTQVTPNQINIDVFDKELEFCNGDLFSNGGVTYKGTLLSVFDEKRKMTIKEIKE